MTNHSTADQVRIIPESAPLKIRVGRLQILRLTEKLEKGDLKAGQQIIEICDDVLELAVEFRISTLAKIEHIRLEITRQQELAAAQELKEEKEDFFSTIATLRGYGHFEVARMVGGWTPPKALLLESAFCDSRLPEKMVEKHIVPIIRELQEAERQICERIWRSNRARRAAMKAAKQS